MATIYVKTLGCKVNTHDSHAILHQFVAAGHAALSSLEGADVAILNTCSVTAQADREARYLARRLKRDNPGVMVVATGCYAQTDSAALLAMPEIDLVVPNEAKTRLVAEVEARLGGKTMSTRLAAGVEVVTANRQGHFKSVLNLAPADPTQTRAFLKIQDGCNGFCTYCLIPYARGQSRSVAAHEVLVEVRRLIDTGIKEIVFTGIHLGDYGNDIDGARTFASLLAELFTWPDMVRVRISSLEPVELTLDLLETLASRRELVCDHFHLPLQSGSDSVLKRMRRSYNAAEYLASVALARRFFPEACLGADVIPGFPGETETEAAATMALVESAGLNYLHVFPYSQRPNTAAAKMPGHLAPELIKSRALALRQWSEQAFSSYQRQFIGRTLPVLWERSTDGAGRRHGLSPNYLAVSAPLGSDPGANVIRTAELRGFLPEGRLAAVPRA